MNNTDQSNTPLSIKDRTCEFIHPNPFQGTIRTETQSDCAINEKQILVQRIECLKMQLSEAAKREEYLRAINQTLRQAIGKLDVDRQLSSQSSSHVGQMFKLATFQDSVEFVKHNSSQQLLINCENCNKMKEHYEQALVCLENEKMVLEKHYLVQLDQMRLDIESEAREFISRQMELMQSEARVHFQKQKLKAEQYIKRLLAEQSQFSPAFPLTPVNTTTNIDTSCEPQSYRSEQRKQIKLSARQKSRTPPHGQKVKSPRIIEDRPSQRRLNDDRNIATDLYCQNCKKVFPPTEFIPHINKCKQEDRCLKERSSSNQNKPLTPSNYYSNGQKNRHYIDLKKPHMKQLNLNTSGSVNQELSSSISNVSEVQESSGPNSMCSSEIDLDVELLQALLKKKQELSYKIQCLKYSKNGENRQQREMLQTDLDQLTLIIQKKKVFQNRSKSRNQLQASRGSIYHANNVSMNSEAAASRIYLQDRPLMKKSMYGKGSKQNVHNNRSLTTSLKESQIHSISTPSAITTPNNAKKLLRRM